jgi:AcrR family transcriptional regulator
MTETRAPSAAAEPTRRRYRGLTPETRREQRRVRLIDAGVEAFGERGFYRTTVREVCQLAGLTERYFYESFEHLEALFVAVYDAINEELKHATLEALERAPRDTVKLAEAALRVYLSFIRDDPRRARIMLVDSVSTGLVALGSAGRAARDFTGIVRTWIHALYPAVPRGTVSIDLLAAGLIGANIHIASHWVRENFQTPLEEVLQTLVAIYQGLSDYALQSLQVAPTFTQPPSA